MYRDPCTHLYTITTTAQPAGITTARYKTKTRPALVPNGVTVEQVSLHSSVVTRKSEKSCVLCGTVVYVDLLCHAQTQRIPTAHNSIQTVQWTCTVYTVTMYGVGVARTVDYANAQCRPTTHDGTPTRRTVYSHYCAVLAAQHCYCCGVCITHAVHVGRTLIGNGGVGDVCRGGTT